MGIAVHSGAVVAGNIGSQDRMKYGVVGPAVNLLSRIQWLASGAQILVSEPLAKRVAAMVTVGPARIRDREGGPASPSPCTRCSRCARRRARAPTTRHPPGLDGAPGGGG